MDCDRLRVRDLPYLPLDINLSAHTAAGISVLDGLVRFLLFVALAATVVVGQAWRATCPPGTVAPDWLIGSFLLATTTHNNSFTGTYAAISGILPAFHVHPFGSTLLLGQGAGWWWCFRLNVISHLGLIISFARSSLPPMTVSIWQLCSGIGFSLDPHLLSLIIRSSSWNQTINTGNW